MKDPYCHMLEQLRRKIKLDCQKFEPPFVTLSFAQSLDGCLAAKAGQTTLLSGPESMIMTHKLRALHDGILVGVDTVLSDNPQLTVRLSAGDSPRPIILDSTLRTPLTSKLLSFERRPLIITSKKARPERAALLEKAGAKVARVSSAVEGLDLGSLMTVLRQEKISSLMVEGGGRVISSFIKRRLVDFLVVTIAPKTIGSADAIRYQAHDLSAQLENRKTCHLGKDLIIWGQPRWQESKAISSAALAGRRI